MECVREIIEPEKLKGIIQIPKEMEQSKVEVIVLPTEEPANSTDVQKKIQAAEELNGLISDQNRKTLDEFDQILNPGITLRKKAIEL